MAQRHHPRHGETIKGEVRMAARQVILYFDDQKDALRFALAAGTVMSGESANQATGELVQEMQRARRIRLDEGLNPGSQGRRTAEPANRKA